MATDLPAAETQSTQQETQPASQTVNILEEHLWGCLLPCSPLCRRVDFQKIKRTYLVGRNEEQRPGGNDIILPGKKISNYHCKIQWDGREERQAAVRVTDTSSNGTFINGIRIGKGRSMLVYEGNEIAFGTSQQQDNPAEDYRFVYRHMAAGTPPTGLHAHYQMHQELGKGSFATVLKAMHREDGEWFAVKVMQRNRLRSPVGNSTAGSPSFAREISILEELQHPNICQLKEVFYEDHTVNLVLEYIDGGDLLDYIVRRGYLTEPQAQYLTYQICDALAYIHSKNIAHRDLKPENVLLTSTNPPQVKVADFGLAKAVDSLTMLRTMCGTPCYLAPEVVLQESNNGYDQIVDSWSVGVIVFSMLTGNNPFFDDDQEMHIKERVRTRAVDWNTLRQYAPQAEKFVSRLLENDPAIRMTASDARLHPWLSEQHYAARGNERDRTASPGLDVGSFDASMVSNVSDDMALDEAGTDGDAGVPAANEDAGYAPMDSQPELQPLQATGSQPGDIPGAFPHSQNGLVRQSSRLQRRAQVILSQQAEEPVESSDDEQPGRKRKALFESSLSTMEEENEEGAAGPSDVQGGTDAGEKKARGAARRRRVLRMKSVVAEGAGSVRAVRRSSRINPSPAKVGRRG